MYLNCLVCLSKPASQRICNMLVRHVKVATLVQAFLHRQLHYLPQHISNAVRFDVDDVCDKTSPLPHMLPSNEYFSSKVQALGLSSDDHVVVYGTAGSFSAARVWWTFKVFGHEKVSVLVKMK
jgi:3-mercaptopyruvate sulfurtransferase SseA